MGTIFPSAFHRWLRLTSLLMFSRRINVFISDWAAAANHAQFAQVSRSKVQSLSPELQLLALSSFCWLAGSSGCNYPLRQCDGGGLLVAPWVIRVEFVKHRKFCKIFFWYNLTKMLMYRKKENFPKFLPSTLKKFSWKDAEADDDASHVLLTCTGFGGTHFV